MRTRGEFLTRRSGLRLVLWVLVNAMALPLSVLTMVRSPRLEAADGPPLPKVVLIGDSIRLGYAKIVAERLAGRAVVVSPKPNGGDSANVLKHLEAWVIRQRPAVVHFNCGIHDLKKSKRDGRFQVPPEAYAANLKKIVERIRAATGATVLFATTTAILDDRAARARDKTEYELLDASAKQYNRVARETMEALAVPVDDLNALLADPETRARLIGGDGIHFTAEGYATLGTAVAVFVGKHLPAPAGDPPGGRRAPASSNAGL
jgi:lysophospholipase L1-like esterase